jgi:hypothetical protein
MFSRIAVATVISGMCLSGTARAAESLQYNRDVRPILAENCFACHGPDSAARKAGLRLDRREDALRAEAFDLKNPEKSAVLVRIHATGKEQMPPAKTKKLLTAAQKETLRRWVAEGADYQPHWSLIAPRRPTLPTVKNSAWVRNPIDRFILADLEKNGLAPAPEADRRTLARRLSLDLTGLPPAPADVEIFVNDKAPDYYERYVEKLMQSPQWGEHRGRYWLDVARYADTHGIHFDNYREIWAYRDWVVRAFNKNQPFDQFTIEQLAGDLLPDRTIDQQIASGFNRCNITSNEGGLIAEEYLVLYTRDRTETTSQVWLGMTAGCAVCHDHKFDPLSQKEFYSLAAFFNNTTQGAMDGNIANTPPIVFVPRPEDRARWEVLQKELAEARKQAEGRKQSARADFDKWLANVKSETIGQLIPSDGLRFHAPLSEGKDNAVQITVDGKPRSVTVAPGIKWEPGHVAASAAHLQPKATIEVADAGDFDKDQAFSYGGWIKLTKNAAFGALLSRMDDQHDFRGWDLWVQQNRIGTHIVSKWPTDALKVVARNPIKTNQWHHVFVTYDGSGKAAGVCIYIDGVRQETAVEADVLKSTIKTTLPLKFAQRTTTSRLDNVVLQDVRIYGRALPGQDVEKLVKGTRAASIAMKPADSRTPAEKEELFASWLSSVDPASQELGKKVADLQKQDAAMRSSSTIAHVMQERPQEAMAFVLFRGDYDKRRDPVKPETPKALPAMPPGLPKNRLGFAHWLLQQENPLMARVTVNRFWQEVFGTGIVRTSGDFGVAGELPSHPELLDWLAVEFREEKWDVQKFFKLMVTSAAYRQAALTTPEKREKDPANKLVSRGPRFRMDAEMVRDCALASSGLLVRKIGGPSVKPYQPEGVWEAVAMIGSNTRDYRSDKGESLYRRSMYTFWKRSAPPASMDIFNAPSRETCTVRRERTNTPLQALVTLNDPQFVESARHLAQTALKEGGDKPEMQIDFISRRLLSRPLRAEEATVVQATLNDLLAAYKAKPEDAKKLIAVGESKADASLDAGVLAAWTMLVNQMMNLDEVLNK